MSTLLPSQTFQIVAPPTFGGKTENFFQAAIVYTNSLSKREFSHIERWPVDHDGTYAAGGKDRSQQRMAILGSPDAHSTDTDIFHITIEAAPWCKPFETLYELDTPEQRAKLLEIELVAQAIGNFQRQDWSEFSSGSIVGADHEKMARYANETMDSGVSEMAAVFFKNTGIGPAQFIQNLELGLKALEHRKLSGIWPSDAKTCYESDSTELFKAFAGNVAGMEGGVFAKLPNGKHWLAVDDGSFMTTCYATFTEEGYESIKPYNNPVSLASALARFASSPVKVSKGINPSLEEALLANGFVEHEDYTGMRSFTNDSGDRVVVAKVSDDSAWIMQNAVTHSLANGLQGLHTAADKPWEQYSDDDTTIEALLEEVKDRLHPALLAQLCDEEGQLKVINAYYFRDEEGLNDLSFTVSHNGFIEDTIAVMRDGKVWERDAKFFAYTTMDRTEFDWLIPPEKEQCEAHKIAVNYESYDTQKLGYVQFKKVSATAQNSIEKSLIKRGWHMEPHDNGMLTFQRSSLDNQIIVRSAVDTDTALRIMADQRGAMPLAFRCGEKYALPDFFETSGEYLASRTLENLIPDHLDGIKHHITNAFGKIETSVAYTLQDNLEVDDLFIRGKTASGSLQYFPVVLGGRFCETPNADLNATLQALNEKAASEPLSNAQRLRATSIESCIALQAIAEKYKSQDSGGYSPAP